MGQRSIFSAADLSVGDVQRIFSLADKLKGAVSPSEFSTLLSGKNVVTLFAENSTRTKLSFELASRKLGASVLSFSSSGSSMAKGESLLDTAKTLVSMGADAIILRSSSSGACHYLSKHLNVPMINAGDGWREHPTQALLDNYTLQTRWGTMKGKRILILGDLLHSRVARSNIDLFTKLGAQVTLCAPAPLMPIFPDKLPVNFENFPDETLKSVDAVMVLRIQLERQNKKLLPSLAEYRQFWGLTRERANILSKNAYILHPGPANLGVEIDLEVAHDDSRSLITEQVSNGVWVRMATLAWALAPERVEKWLDQH